MATGSSGISTPALATVYWEVSHGTSTNNNFSLRSGTAVLDADGRTGTFTVPTINDGTYAGDKTFSVDIYKDSTKSILLASSVLVTVKDSTVDQTTISKRLWSGLELYGASPKMDGYEAYLGDPRWLPNGV